MSLSRWWTLSDVTVEDWLRCGDNKWHGRRFPLIAITEELLRDSPFMKRYNAWHIKVHHDFDRELHIFAWWPIAPLAKLCYWWRYRTKWRYCIEHAMHGRIADKPEGEMWTSWTWRFRVPSRWTWHRTRLL